MYIKSMIDQGKGFSKRYKLLYDIFHFADDKQEWNTLSVSFIYLPGIGKGYFKYW